jgi:2-methylcitrate dehydratase PrpD
MSGSHITARIAEWVSAAKYEDLPRRVVEEAKNQILSMIAAVHAGHFSDVGRTVSRTVRDWAGGKEATLIPSGERTSVHYAIFGNAALSMALDYDDYLFAGHTGHSAVLTTLALAEKLSVRGRDFILAQVLANEIEGRLGASVLLGPLSSQMSSFLHVIGSAVIAAKLMNLEATQTENAIAIAFLQPTYTLQPAFFGSEAKTILAAQTAPVGVQAAELAANGMRGASDAIEGDHGFLQTFTPQPLLEAFDGFGSVWLTDTLSYKLYPGCAYIHACIDCVLALVRQHHIDAATVRAIHVAASPLTLGMEALAAPYVKGPESLAPTLSFSLAYNVAAALIDRELTARQFLRDRIKDPAVWNLAGKVQLRLDDEMGRRSREHTLLRPIGTGAGDGYTLDLTTTQVSHFKAAFGARVRIEMDDGHTFEMEEEIPQGGAGRAFDDRRRAAEDKFRRETRYTLRKERMEAAIDLAYHIEEGGAAQIRELVRLSCSERV